MTKGGFDWSSASQQPLFKVRTTEDTLLISFPRPRDVISWAPLHGGLRTQAGWIVSHRFKGQFDLEDAPKIIRRAAGKAHVQGKFVGMITSADVAKYSLKKSSNDDLHVWTLSTASTEKLATVGDDAEVVEGRPSLMQAGAISVVVALNYYLSHEGMMEAMAVVTEAKVKVLYELGLCNPLTNQLATGGGMDCVAIACGHDRRYQYCGKRTKWGELVGKTCLESLKEAIRLAILPQKEVSSSGQVD